MLEETMSREELLDEMAALRRRVTALEATTTERSRAELALRQSEDRLRAVVTNAPIVLFAVDSNGVFTISEGAGLMALGREQGQAVGQSAYELYADQPVVLDSVRRALSGEPVRSSVEVNGIAFDTHYLPLRGEGGEIIGAIGVATDVTERKRAEEAERQRNRELETLYTIARTLSQPGTIEVKATQALEEITKIFEAEWAGLRLYDKEEDGLRLIASVGEGLDQYPPPLVIKGSQMMSGEAFRKGQPLVINDYPSYPNALPGRIAQGVKSAVSMVIKAGDRPVGTINVNSKRPNHFTPQRVRFLSAVASGMGSLLDNASLAEAVRESEEKYRILFERSRDAIFISRDRVVIDANQAALDMFGYTRGEAIGFNTRDAYDNPDDATRVRRELDEKGFVRNAEVRFRRKDGSKLDCLLTITRRRSEDGEHTSDYGIVHDITERKRAEELFRTLAQSSPVGMFVIQDGKFSFVNNQFAAETGFQPHELIGRDSLSLVHPDDREQVRDYSARMLEGKLSNPYEFRGLDKNGGEFWLISTVAPVEYEGKPAVVGTYMDVTERKRAEEAIRQSEEEARRLAHENAMMAEIGRIIGSSLDLDEVYEGFAEQVRQIVPFDRISVGIVSEDGGTFTDSYSMGLHIPNRGFGVVSALYKSVTAELVRTRKGMIVLMNDEDELSEKFPLMVAGFRAGLRTSMSVPLISKDEVIGALHLQSITPNAYTERELALAGRVGYYIASAIENARLYEEAGEAAVLGERNRMAREIHDTMAQGFTGIILQMEAAEQSFDDEPSVIPVHLARAKNLARECLQEARRSVWNLLPKALEQRPLDSALEEEVRLFNSASHERASFSVSGHRRELPSDVQAALLRICQESLTNIRKHAQAASVEVTLAYQHDAVRLKVRDDGKGFDPDARKSQPGLGGFGLTGMQQRARLLRGVIEVASEKGRGTRVEVTIPTS